MIDGILNLIGRNAKLLAAALVVLIVANVGFQFYTHKTTTLTAWKGGGFGMYTETHLVNRTVWLELSGANGTAQLRVFPENADIRTWIEGVSRKGGARLQRITNLAEKLHYYPRMNGANALIESASIGWLDSLTGGITPKEGKVFKAADIRVLVYETYQDMDAEALKRRIIFAVPAQGGA